MPRGLAAELVAGVGKLAGAQIQANVQVGLFHPRRNAVVRIGSTVYDGSVRGRLERLKAAVG
jgi:F-type H+-transporting ATPase subunit delta